MNIGVIILGEVILVWLFNPDPHLFLPARQATSHVTPRRIAHPPEVSPSGKHANQRAAQSKYGARYAKHRTYGPDLGWDSQELESSKV